MLYDKRKQSLKDKIIGRLKIKTEEKPKVEVNNKPQKKKK